MSPEFWASDYSALAALPVCKLELLVRVHEDDAGIGRVGLGRHWWENSGGCGKKTKIKRNVFLYSE